MNLTLNTKFIKGFVFFIIIFYSNIGMKEILTMLKNDSILQILIIGFSFFLTIISMIIVAYKKKYLYLFLITILFATYLLINSIYVRDFNYSIQKIFLGLIFPLSLFLILSIKKWDEINLIKYLTFSVLLISIIGIIYKSVYGFSTRSVKFGLLGPITFGWINGMALLAIALKKSKKKYEWFIMLFFFWMVIWTGSKGPLIGLCLFIILNLRKILGTNFKMKGSVLIALIIISISFVFIYKNIDKIRSIKMFVDFFNDPESYTTGGSGEGSFGLRIEYIKASIDLFLKNHFFGVGFGGWQENVKITNHKYPHNIILEILSESGIIGLLFLLILFFQFNHKNTFNSIGLFGIVCLLFSGDFSYFRYAFFPLLIGFYLNKENKEQLALPR